MNPALWRVRHDLLEVLATSLPSLEGCVTLATDSVVLGRLVAILVVPVAADHHYDVVVDAQTRPDDPVGTRTRVVLARCSTSSEAARACVRAYKKLVPRSERRLHREFLTVVEARLRNRRSLLPGGRTPRW